MTMQNPQARLMMESGVLHPGGKEWKRETKPYSNKEFGGRS